MSRRCGDCMYWDYTTDQAGLCRRNAPVPIPQPASKSQQFTLVIPSTSKDDWCGQFEHASIRHAEDAA